MNATIIEENLKEIEKALKELRDSIKKDRENLKEVNSELEALDLDTPQSRREWQQLTDLSNTIEEKIENSLNELPELELKQEYYSTRSDYIGVDSKINEAIEDTKNYNKVLKARIAAGQTGTKENVLFNSLNEQYEQFSKKNDGYHSDLEVAEEYLAELEKAVVPFENKYGGKVLDNLQKEKLIRETEKRISDLAEEIDLNFSKMTKVADRLDELLGPIEGIQDFDNISFNENNYERATDLKLIIADRIKNIEKAAPTLISDKDKLNENWLKRGFTKLGNFVKKLKVANMVRANEKLMEKYDPSKANDLLKDFINSLGKSARTAAWGDVAELKPVEAKPMGPEPAPPLPDSLKPKSEQQNPATPPHEIKPNLNQYPEPIGPEPAPPLPESLKQNVSGSTVAPQEIKPNLNQYPELIGPEKPSQTIPPIEPLVPSPKPVFDIPEPPVFDPSIMETPKSANIKFVSEEPIGPENKPGKYVYKKGEPIPIKESEVTNPTVTPTVNNAAAEQVKPATNHFYDELLSKINKVQEEDIKRNEKREEEKKAIEAAKKSKEVDENSKKIVAELREIEQKNREAQAKEEQMMREAYMKETGRTVYTNPETDKQVDDILAQIGGRSR